MSYAELLDAVDELTIEEQVDIAELIKRRAIEKRRDALLKDIEESTLEFNSGKLHPQTVDEIMKDLLS